jgi:hypothetical protein
VWLIPVLYNVSADGELRGNIPRHCHLHQLHTCSANLFLSAWMGLTACGQHGSTFASTQLHHVSRGIFYVLWRLHQFYKKKCNLIFYIFQIDDMLTIGMRKMSAINENKILLMYPVAKHFRIQSSIYFAFQMPLRRIRMVSLKVRILRLLGIMTTTFPIFYVSPCDHFR